MNTERHVKALFILRDDLSFEVRQADNKTTERMVELRQMESLASQLTRALMDWKNMQAGGHSLEGMG
jgi:hypothetical protein